LAIVWDETSRIRITEEASQMAVKKILIAAGVLEAGNAKAYPGV
jgi:hypothetical protein